MTLFILVRHGQTDWNKADRFRGRADLALNEEGLHQAAAAGRRIAGQWQPAAVYSSPLRRAIETGGRRIAQQHYVPQPPDFPISRAEPAYLKTVWLRLD